MTLTLRVIQGRPQGKFLHFRQGEYVFGRGAECHIRPNSVLISRQHCLLRVGERIFIRDLGSSNGTLVNGDRVLDDRDLKPGDRLQLGPLVLEVVESPANEAAVEVVEGNTAVGADTMQIDALTQHD